MPFSRSICTSSSLMSKWFSIEVFPGPVTNRIRRSPAAVSSSQTYCTTGLRPTGSISFGCDLVAGSSRVPESRNRHDGDVNAHRATSLPVSNHTTKSTKTRNVVLGCVTRIPRPGTRERNVYNSVVPRLATALCAVLTILPGATPAIAQPLYQHLRLIAPAAPGGGWDQTARVMQQALQSAGVVHTSSGREHSGRGGDDRPRALRHGRARRTAT